MFTIQFGDYSFPNQTFVVKSDPLSNNYKETTIPRAHGSISLTTYLQSRKIKIRGVIHNPLESDSLTQLLAMQKALLNGEQNLYIRSDRYIKAKVVDIDTDYEEGLDKRVVNCDLIFRASCPFYYSAGLSLLVGLTMAGGTYDFDVDAGGNVFTEPVIFFYNSGAITINDAIELINLSDSSTALKYRGEVPPGVTLMVDADQMKVALGPVDGLSDFEGNFVSLLNGVNSLRYVGDACHISIEYKSRWYN